MEKCHHYNRNVKEAPSQSSQCEDLSHSLPVYSHRCSSLISGMKQDAIDMMLGNYRPVRSGPGRPPLPPVLVKSPYLTT